MSGSEPSDSFVLSFLLTWTGEREGRKQVELLDFIRKWGDEDPEKRRKKVQKKWIEGTEEVDKLF